MRLKEYRVKKSLTQMELAKIVGVNQTAISQWERGVNLPRVKTCLKVANILGCSLSELLNDVENKKNLTAG